MAHIDPLPRDAVLEFREMLDNLIASIALDLHKEPALTSHKHLKFRRNELPHHVGQRHGLWSHGPHCRPHARGHVDHHGAVPAGIARDLRSCTKLSGEAAMAFRKITAIIQTDRLEAPKAALGAAGDGIVAVWPLVRLYNI